jgi:hypothetical protein
MFAGVNFHFHGNRKEEERKNCEEKDEMMKKVFFFSIPLEQEDGEVRK